METKNMIGGIVSLAVVVICVAAIMMPVLGEYTAAEKTYTNEGVPYAAYDGEEHTIIVSYVDSAYVVTVDGETCETPDLSLYGSATLVYGEEAFIRLSKTGQVRGYTSDGLIQGGNVSASVTSTITLSSTGATLAFSSTTNTMTFTPVAHIATEGTYVLCQKPCVDDDTIIIGGVTTDSDVALGYVAIGTVDSLSSSVVYTDFLGAADPPTVTSVDTTVNTTEVDGDLVRIDSVVFTTTLSDETTKTGTYTYFLAPATITYDNPEYLGGGNSALVLAIPTIVIAAMVIAAVGTFVIGRRD